MRQMVAGVAVHWYSGDHFEALEMVRRLYPEKRLVFSECCVEYSKYGAGDELRSARLYAREIIGDLNGGVDAFIHWSLVFDPKGGPNHVNNLCEAVVFCDWERQRVVYTLPYYYIGHFSRFIKPGAVRIGFSRYTEKLDVTAFLNPDGERVVVVLNKTAQDVPFVLRERAQTCRVTAKGDGILTPAVPAMRIGANIDLNPGDPAQWIEMLQSIQARAAVAPINCAADGEERRAYRKAAAENDIVIAEVGVWNNPLDPDDTARRSAVAYAKGQLALAEELGARCCVNVAGARGPVWDGAYAENRSKDAYALIVDTVRGDHRRGSPHAHLLHAGAGGLDVPGRAGGKSRSPPGRRPRRLRRASGLYEHDHRRFPIHEPRRVYPVLLPDARALCQERTRQGHPPDARHALLHPGGAAGAGGNRLCGGAAADGGASRHATARGTFEHAGRVPRGDRAPVRRRAAGGHRLLSIRDKGEGT